MKPIENLKPGSTLSVWVFEDGEGQFDEFEPTEWDAELQEDGTLEVFKGMDKYVYEWKDVSANPRDAIRAYIRKVDNEISERYSRIERCETMLKTQYPIHPVLSEEEFKKKYPHLPGWYRTQDFPPKDLERENQGAWWQENKYNEPG